VGTFAVQIAKHHGSHVSGVSGRSNLELVESLGADEVIDYTKQDFTEGEGKYDLIFDAVGKTSAQGVRRALAENGAFVTTQSRRTETARDLLTVRDMLETGAVQAVIDSRYRLDQVHQAHRHVERGHKRGNLLVVVVP
jgi:NADPH:quinone reductase-like Zn-dependent oxidoreductase